MRYCARLVTLVLLVSLAAARLDAQGPAPAPGAAPAPPAATTYPARFPVKVKGRWGYIDRSGKLVIPATSRDEPWGFSEGLAVAQGPAGLGYIDTDGKMVVPATYRLAFKFHGGVAVVVRPDSKAVVIDRTGKPVTPAVAWEGNLSTYGRFIVRDGRWLDEAPAAKNARGQATAYKYGYRDLTGKLVIPMRYTKACPFSEGLALVTREDRRSRSSFYLDTTGKVAIRATYRWVKVSKGKRAPGYWTGPSGRTAHPSGPLFTFPLLGDFSEGRAVAMGYVKVGKDYVLRYGIIDATGKWVARPRWEHVQPFSEGRAVVYRRVPPGGPAVPGGLRPWGYIDRAGTEVIPLRYWYARPFSEGLAAVQTGPGFGFIDKTGAVVIPPNFEDALPFRNGLAQVQEHWYVKTDDPHGERQKHYSTEGDWTQIVGKIGYIDRTGKLVWPMTE